MQQFHPHPYQQAGIEAILEKPGVALWMEMGLGKTRPADLRPAGDQPGADRSPKEGRRGDVAG